MFSVIYMYCVYAQFMLNYVVIDSYKSNCLQLIVAKGLLSSNISGLEVH